MFTKAVTEFLSRHRQDDVTEQLNKVYGKQESALDPVIQGLQASSVSREKWQCSSQLITTDKRFLTERIRSIDPHKMKEVEAGIRLALAI